jgi:hypothetical protein
MFFRITTSTVVKLEDVKFARFNSETYTIEIFLTDYNLELVATINDFDKLCDALLSLGYTFNPTFTYTGTPFTPVLNT